MGGSFPVYMDGCIGQYSLTLLNMQQSYLTLLFSHSVLVTKTCDYSLIFNVGCPTGSQYAVSMTDFSLWNNVDILILFISLVSFVKVSLLLRRGIPLRRVIHVCLSLRRRNYYSQGGKCTLCGLLTYGQLAPLVIFKWCLSTHSTSILLTVEDDFSKPWLSRTAYAKIIQCPIRGRKNNNN